MRHILSGILLLFFTLPAWSAEVKTTDNLQQLYQSKADQRVLLLLVSQPGCSYCDLIKQEILEPMLVSGLYNDSTLIREIKINANQLIRDFDNHELDATNFANRYNAWATPTLLFLDKRGRELTDKMVGINTPELYGYYVDKALLKAQAALKQ
ncbi:MAG: thioredoxin family protein [Pontibacterium sp.]